MGSIPMDDYKVGDHHHSHGDKLRVINIGAGAAGLLIAYRMKKLFTNYELVCYEKNPHIAGTWYENRYPGCACDIPAHVYTYPFEPNPSWSSFYASGPEIRQYFETFAAKHDLFPYVSLNSRVLEAIWIEEQGIYKVVVDIAGEQVEDWCHVLINGTGFLNDWKWPDIRGLHDFRGTLMHTANWDESVDCRGKDIAVIGSGSSGIQIVPQMQKVAKSLVCFMRSVTWISQPLGSNIIQGGGLSNGNENKPVSQENTQHYYSEEEKRRFRDDPSFLLEYRQKLEQDFNAGFDVYLRDSKLSKNTQRQLAAEMQRRLGSGHEELKKKLIPSWPPGCKRLTPGDGFLEALTTPNTKTVHEGITKIVPDGLIDQTGNFHKVDVIICATGFNLAFTPVFELRGVGGIAMKELFDPEPQVYLGTTVPKFPNYFVVNGPRGAWASGCVLSYLDAQTEYILKCVKRIQDEGIKAFEVKQEAVDQLYEHIEAFHKLTVWDAPCKSWYRTSNGKLWMWGGSGLHYMKTLKEIRYEHYNFRYKNKNMWAFLGNGKVQAEALAQTELLAPYIRNSDTPWEIA